MLELLFSEKSLVLEIAGTAPEGNDVQPTGPAHQFDKDDPSTLAIRTLGSHLQCLRKQCIVILRCKLALGVFIKLGRSCHLYLKLQDFLLYLLSSILLDATPLEIFVCTSQRVKDCSCWSSPLCNPGELGLV